MKRVMKPMFFAGQLLTDEDLQAIVDWTQDRLAGAARRDGLGRRSGMDVRIDGPMSLAVAAGVAVGADGEELVLATEARCAIDPAVVTAAVRAGRAADARAIGGFDVGSGKVVDLLLRARSGALLGERLRPVMRDDSLDCAPVASRVREVVELEVIEQPPVTDVDRKAFAEQLAACARMFHELGRAPGAGDGRRQWFAERALGMWRFGFVERMLRGANANAWLEGPGNVARLVFFVALDRRLTLVAGRRPPTSDAVGLARIRVLHDDPNSDILDVEPLAGPPAGPLPASPGHVCVLTAVGRPLADAVAELRALGLAVDGVASVDVPADLVEVEAWLGKPVEFPLGSRVVLEVGTHVPLAGLAVAVRAAGPETPHVRHPGFDLRRVLGRNWFMTGLLSIAVGGVAYGQAPDLNGAGLGLTIAILVGAWSLSEAFFGRRGRRR